MHPLIGLRLKRRKKKRKSPEWGQFPNIAERRGEKKKNSQLGLTKLTETDPEEGKLQFHNRQKKEERALVCRGGRGFFEGRRKGGDSDLWGVGNSP